jgi:ABC-type uncharacterized transport system substrate-binding protein
MALAAVAAIAAAVPAQAHPHVWVKARSQLIYGPDGRIMAVSHQWTFDEGYSAFAVMGLDTNGDGKTSREELADLAKVNAESLGEFNYFTVIKVDGKKLAFGPPRDYALDFNQGALTFTFVLPILQPVAVKKVLNLELYDPTFFVAFDFVPDGEPVTLSGAPQGCVVKANHPPAPDPAQKQRLDEAFFSNLSPGGNFGAQFAPRAFVACP